MEPWLRGTLTEVPAVQRAVLHALELTKEDIIRWCRDLTGDELNARPFSLPSVAFHIRHIARSCDRLLTYAEESELSAEQLTALDSESAPDAERDALFTEFTTALDSAAARVRAFSPAQFEDPRYIGRKRLPATLAGILVHIADHTQRHTGQAVSTAKLLLALRHTRV